MFSDISNVCYNSRFVWKGKSPKDQFEIKENMSSGLLSNFNMLFQWQANASDTDTSGQGRSGSSAWVIKIVFPVWKELSRKENDWNGYPES